MERPILFSGPMVRAILEGRKTQTRRVIKPQPDVIQNSMWDGGAYLKMRIGNLAIALSARNRAGDFCPYGKPGDRLWVREAWAVHKYYDGRPGNGCGPIPEGITVECREAPDAVTVLPGHMHRRIGNKPPDERGKWRPSIFMPRWASRITLEIVSVRVERLQEISFSDIRAEGKSCPEPEHDFDSGFCASECDALRNVWATGWDTINGKRKGCAWSDNPWVWVIEFKKL
jgi:hypothetical protein